MEDQIPEHPINPLLGRIQIPGESYTLPSRALFYNDGEVTKQAHDRGEVHIHPMTAIDELVMRSPDKVLNGDAVVEVFARCIPEVLKPHQMLQRDIDFLVAALRKVSYGDDMELPYTHNCKDAKQQTYKMNMSEMLGRSKALDPTTIAGKFTVNMENQQKVVLEPMRYKDVLELMSAMVDTEDLLDPETQEKYLISSLLRVIVSVDDIDDDNMMEEWLRQIPIKWAQQISEAIDETTKWGPDFEFHTTCKDCNEKITIEAPMNPISFFM